MKLFTLAEAEAALVGLRDHVAAMQQCKREVDALREQLAHAAERSTGNGHVQDRDELAATRRRAEMLVERMNEHLAVINAAGVEMKDADQGLLDFPSEREGRVVYLCWKLGEDSIAWWHDVDTGFAGRRPL